MLDKCAFCYITTNNYYNLKGDKTLFICNINRNCAKNIKCSFCSTSLIFAIHKQKLSLPYICDIYDCNNLVCYNCYNNRNCSISNLTLCKNCSYIELEKRNNKFVKYLKQKILQNISLNTHSGVIVKYIKIYF